MEDTKPIWVPAFSQTGKEIADIVDLLKCTPTYIVTNAPEEKIDPRIFSYGVEIRRLPSKPSADQYFAAFPRELNAIITLHGWLRIIPAEVCDAFDGRILNGHPALLTEYPSLKGKDKQEDVAGNPAQYEKIGSVIHKVTSQLDEGEILYSCSRKNTSTDISSAYSLLRETSLQTWLNCLGAMFTHNTDDYNNHTILISTDPYMVIANPYISNKERF